MPNSHKVSMSKSENKIFWYPGRILMMLFSFPLKGFLVKKASKGSFWWSAALWGWSPSVWSVFRFYCCHSESIERTRTGTGDTWGSVESWSISVIPCRSIHTFWKYHITTANFVVSLGFYLTKTKQYKIKKGSKHTCHFISNHPPLVWFS